MSKTHIDLLAFANKNKKQILTKPFSEIYSPNDGRWESGPDTPTYAYYYGLVKKNNKSLFQTTL